MSAATPDSTIAPKAVRTDPPFIFDASFTEADAEEKYGSFPAIPEESSDFMPDEVTRGWTQRMHYAAWRAHGAANPSETTRWRERYRDCRNRIVLGNRKLTYRAVRKWRSGERVIDDMIGECQIVLIKAVAAFNPWLGIRFSTYAFTCLIRALSRLSQRQAVDRLLASQPLESLPQGEPGYVPDERSSPPGLEWLREYLREDATLLTAREKLVLILRFHLNDEAAKIETLEQVGRNLGLSKERVRQVQMAALGKLRSVLSAARETS